MYSVYGSEKKGNSKPNVTVKALPGHFRSTAMQPAFALRAKTLKNGVKIAETSPTPHKPERS